MRDWSREEALRSQPIATFLGIGNLSELATIAFALRPAGAATGNFAGRENELAVQLTGQAYGARRSRGTAIDNRQLVSIHALTRSATASRP